MNTGAALSTAERGPVWRCARDSRRLSTPSQLLSFHEASLGPRASTAPVALFFSLVGTALAATIPDAKAFRSAREFAAWLGLVPRQSSSGGRERLGGITKMGHAYLRRLLVLGAQAVLRQAARGPDHATPWLSRLLREKPRKVAAVALANKTARIVWALLARGEAYRLAA